MNPYQQPQNNAYNPQNNGYPQQAGPNKYPTLTPVQNPQYPPQQPQDPGYNAQARPTGYQPPAQYGNVQAGTSKNEERQAVLLKIADLDQGFNTCFLTLYKVWLWLLAILYTISFVGSFLAFIDRRDSSGAFFLTSFFLMAFNVSQSRFGLKAISDKSLGDANVACVMMPISLIPWLVLEIFMIYVVSTDKRGGRYDLFALEVFLLGVCTLMNFIHIGLSINGAFKVRKLLIDRALLEEKLYVIDYSLRA